MGGTGGAVGDRETWPTFGRPPQGDSSTWELEGELRQLSPGELRRAVHHFRVEVEHLSSLLARTGSLGVLLSSEDDGCPAALREPIAADLVAHLHARPDLAAEVVDALKVARPWSGRSVTCRDRLNGEVAATLHPGESYEMVDALLAADGWTFTTRRRDG